MTYRTEPHKLYKAQKERWKRIKSESIDYKGGCCSRCGYDKCEAALEFHHLDPLAKEANWSKIRLWSEERRLSELDKCILLCANCHREEHYYSPSNSNDF